MRERLNDRNYDLLHENDSNTYRVMIQIGNVKTFLFKSNQRSEAPKCISVHGVSSETIESIPHLGISKDACCETTMRE